MKSILFAFALTAFGSISFAQGHSDDSSVRDWYYSQICHEAGAPKAEGNVFVRGAHNLVTGVDVLINTFGGSLEFGLGAINFGLPVGWFFILDGLGRVFTTTTMQGKNHNCLAGFFGIDDALVFIIDFAFFAARISDDIANELAPKIIPDLIDLKVRAMNRSAAGEVKPFGFIKEGLAILSSHPLESIRLFRFAANQNSLPIEGDLKIAIEEFELQLESSGAKL